MVSEGLNKHRVTLENLIGLDDQLIGAEMVSEGKVLGDV